jgi:hypothetical protein
VLVKDFAVSEFFREAVAAAMRNQGIQASVNVEAYLVGLLGEYLNAERLVTREAFFHRPLCELMLGARLAPPGERLTKYKEIGDIALYMAGYFGDAVERRGVDLDYYIELGGGAYAAVASHMRARTGGAAFDELYGELSGHFASYVDVFGEVAEHAVGQRHQNLLRLYERWRRTRSSWMTRKLQSAGVFPSGGSNDGRTH